MSEHGTCLRRYRLHPNDLHRSAPAQRTAADEEKASRRASYEAYPKSTRSNKWKNEKVIGGARMHGSRRNLRPVVCCMGTTKNRKGLSGGMARGQSRQSGQGNNGKGLRR